MKSFFLAFSIALVLTSMFAFRFEMGRRPGMLALYFALFFGLEVVVGHTLVPPDAIPIAAAWVCLGLSAAFIVATWLSHRYADANPADDDSPGT